MVYRLSGDAGVYFVKIATPPDHSKFRYLPYDFLPLLSGERLSYEVCAIQAAAHILPAHSTPEIVAYDRGLGVLVLRDAGGTEGRLLEDVLLDGASLELTEQLGRLVGRLARRSAEVVDIRGADECRARIAKLRYGYLFPALSLARAKPEMRQQVREFYARSVSCEECLTHGDLHARNVIVRGDGSVALIDFEESLKHDLAYDIGVLLASYLLTLARVGPTERAKLLKLAVVLVSAFCREVGLDCNVDSRRTLEQRVRQYAAGAVMDRCIGIAKPTWMSNPLAQSRVKRIAETLFEAPANASLEECIAALE